MEGMILGMTVTAALMALGRAIVDRRPVSIDERAERLYAWMERCSEAELERRRRRHLARLEAFSAGLDAAEAQDKAEHKLVSVTTRDPR